MTEQHKLVAEKNALIETVKRLNREVAKLEHFKRNLLQQLQNDCEVRARVRGGHTCQLPRVGPSLMAPPTGHTASASASKTKLFGIVMPPTANV